MPFLAEIRIPPIVVVTAKDLTESDRRRLNGSVTEVLAKGSFSQDELLEICGSTSSITSSLRRRRRALMPAHPVS